MLASPPARALRFDAFTLDLSRCVVLRGDREVPLRRQSFDVLHHLGEHAGQIVSRQQLLDAVWPGVKVTEDSVVQCIKEIRQALGEEARWIVRTVSRRGYVFMAEVIVVDPQPAHDTPASPQSGGGEAGKSTPAPVAAEPSAGSAPVRWQPLRFRWQHALIGAGVLVAVLAIGGVAAWRLVHPAPDPVLTMMAEPSIAVLPFKALDDKGLRVGVGSSPSDDIVTAIGRTPPGPMMSLK